MQFMQFPFGQRTTRFERRFRCYPVSFHNKPELENGDKIVLPPSALDLLVRLQIDYPMMFRLDNTNNTNVRSTHCGVMEFSAPEGHCYLPYWMMQNLLLGEGEILQVTNVTLKKAKYVKFRPRTKDFLDISNPKAVLEKSLRTYTALTKGDQICISYNRRKYFVDVLEVRPDGHASIIETDVSIDFAPPSDYVEPPKPKSMEAAAPAPPVSQNSTAGNAAQGSGSASTKGKLPDMDATALLEKGRPMPPKPEGVEAFTGAGQRLDGKPRKDVNKSKPKPSADSMAALAEERRKRASAAAEARRIRNVKKTASAGRRRLGRRAKEQAFGGTGHTLSS